MKIRFALLAAAILVLSACSTTRVLQPGQYRLKANKVKITNDPQFRTSQVTPYIKQQVSSGWNPMMSVYNWQNPDSDGFLSRFARKVGVAPVVYNAALLPASIENIDKHLEYLGYYDSQISTRVDTSKRTVVVNYDVELGRRYRVDSVFFSVPDDGSFQEEFYADTASSLVHPGIYLSENLLEQESARGAAYFRDLGYYDFNKSFYTFVADTLNHPDSTILEYRIERYSRNAGEATAKPLRKYTIGDVSISHSSNIPFREKVLRDLNTVKPGQIYSESEINKTYTRLSQLKLFNSIRMELEPEDSTQVSCNILLSESKQRGFKVQLEASTNSSGLIGISPQLNFFHKNLFHGGEWLNLGFSGNFQTMIGNPDIHSTEFSTAVSLSFPRILGLPNRVFKGAYIPRTEISVSGSYQDRSEFTRSVASIDLGFVGNLSKEFYYTVYPLQFKYVNVAATPEFKLQLMKNNYLYRSFSPHVDAGVSASFQYITNTDIVPKTSYHYVKLSLNSSGAILNLFKNVLPFDEDYYERTLLCVPYSQYVRAELTLGRTLRFGQNDSQALAMRLLAGAGLPYGNSSALPFEQLFYVGGPNSLRGWQIRSVGPGFLDMSDFFSIPSQTGDIRLEANLEYRFPLFWKLEGAVFLETGNIWNMPLPYDIPFEQNADLGFFSFKDFYKSLAADWGLGLRVNLDFILLRLDAGVKIHDPSRPEGQRWVGSDQWLQRDGFAIHFGVGYPF